MRQCDIPGLDDLPHNEVKAGLCGRKRAQLFSQRFFAPLGFTRLIKEDHILVLQAKDQVNITFRHVFLEKATDLFRTPCSQFLLFKA
jgi:hypothetical protein